MRAATPSFSHEPEQDVLGADVVVLERARLFLRENDHLTGSRCESLKHALAPVKPGRWRACTAAAVCS